MAVVVAAEEVAVVAEEVVEANLELGGQAMGYWVGTMVAEGTPSTTHQHHSLACKPNHLRLGEGIRIRNPHPLASMLPMRTKRLQWGGNDLQRHGARPSPATNLP